MEETGVEGIAFSPLHLSPLPAHSEMDSSKQDQEVTALKMYQAPSGWEGGSGLWS